MRRKALKVAFPHTLPILTGFAFLGLAYGIYMNTSGFPFYYPMLMSMLTLEVRWNLSQLKCCLARSHRCRYLSGRCSFRRVIWFLWAVYAGKI